MKFTPLRYRPVVAILLAAQCWGAASGRLALTFYRQQKDGCGAASVAMVMRYWADASPAARAANPAPEEVYQRLYRPELRGIRLADMKAYLEGKGFEAFTLRGAWPDVEEQVAKGRPIIVGLKKKPAAATHFVVVTGVGEGSVWLNDPTRKKPNLLKRAEFERQWELADRWLLLAAPSGRP